MRPPWSADRRRIGQSPQYAEQPSTPPVNPSEGTVSDLIEDYEKDRPRREAQAKAAFAQRKENT